MRMLFAIIALAFVGSIGFAAPAAAQDYRNAERAARMEIRQYYGECYIDGWLRRPRHVSECDVFRREMRRMSRGRVLEQYRGGYVRETHGRGVYQGGGRPAYGESQRVTVEVPGARITYEQTEASPPHRHNRWCGHRRR